MNTEKFHYCILIFSFLACSFLFIDTYIIPVHTHAEKVINKYQFKESSRRSTYYFYEMETAKRRFPITEAAYLYIGINDTIVINSSVLTKAVNNILEIEEDSVFIYPVGFINGRLGYFFTLMIIIFITLFFIFYRKLNYQPGKNTFTYMMLIASLFLLCYYTGFYFK